ncbi:MAG: hypothetical protein Kow00106_21240 [Anaerolineae bacterium]
MEPPELYPEPSAMPAQELRLALNRIASRGLRPTALLLGLVYLLHAAMLLIARPAEASDWLIAVEAALGIASLGLSALLGRRALPPHYAHPVGTALLLLLVIAVCAYHLEMTPPLLTSFSLLVITAGYLYLDRRWLIFTWLILVGAWAYVVERAYPQISTQEFLTDVLASLSIGVLAHIIRMGALKDMLRSRYRESYYRTAWQRAAHEARQNEARFRRLSEATFEGVVIHEDGIVLDANQVLLDMFGVTLEQVKGRDALAYLIPEDRERLRRNIVERRAETLETMGIRADGSHFPIEINGKVIMDSDRAVRVAAVRDITDRKRLEAEREQLIAELDAYAHTVAHDLKNPLSLVLAYADLLREDLDVAPEETLREYLAGLTDGAQKMFRIIDDLLLLAQVRHGQVQPEPLRMGDIVAEAQRLLQPAITERGATITCMTDWPLALGYAPWIEHVWLNYLSNALKYGGDPPIIEVGATEQDNNMVRFWVRDHGPGLSPEQLAHVFEAFKRGTQHHGEGHGVGLSIVQRIVTRLGGQVGVENVPDGGCLFYFTLPRADVPQAQAAR